MLTGERNKCGFSLPYVETPGMSRLWLCSVEIGDYIVSMQCNVNKGRVIAAPSGATDWRTYDNECLEVKGRSFVDDL